jgi:dipicolinate synthase subunit A
MKKNIVVIGGDARTPYVIDNLINRGYLVSYTGVLSGNDKAKMLNNNDLETLKAKAILFPVSGVTKNGIIGEIMVDDSFFAVFKDVLFFSGIETDYLKIMRDKYNLKIIYLNNQPLFNKINSIATAEAVLKLIIDHKKQIFNEITIMVLGYGKSGKEITDLLIRVGAKVIVVTRSIQSQMEASTMAKYVTSFEELDQYLPYVDVIINTVPSLVVTKEVLGKINKNTYVLDIASLPGGVDFEEAKRLGIKAELALKLPSIYAPISSSRGMVEAIIKELET